MSSDNDKPARRPEDSAPAVESSRAKAKKPKKDPAKPTRAKANRPDFAPTSPEAPRGPAPAPGSGRRPTTRRTAAPISAPRIRRERRRKVSAKARRRITRSTHRSPESIRSSRARSGSVRKTPPPYPRIKSGAGSPPQAGEGEALRQAGEGNGRSRPTSSP